MSKILLFDRWDMEEVKVDDPGLIKHINLDPIIIPKSSGRFGHVAFHKSKMCIVERFINKLYVPGHRGKKHKITSGRCVGDYQTLYLVIQKAFEMIHKKTNKNPVQVLVNAIENSATYEEIAGYRLGGTIARKAVITSPQRRVDLALRYITQGIYRSSFKAKQPLENIIANELVAAANNDPKSFGVMERQRLEKEAEGAR